MENTRKYGILKQGMFLLGTQLSLKKGQKVSCIPANNLPDKPKFYAMPIYGMWEHKGNKWKDTESGILVTQDEVNFFR